MKKITDKYYQIIEHQSFLKEIGEKYFKELENFAQNNPTLLSYSKKGELKANQYVGIIQTKSGFVLEILPKIAQNNDYEQSKRVFLKMLKTLQNSSFKLSNEATLKAQKYPLLEIFIEMFLDEVAILIKKGIKSNYILKNETQTFLKGKLKINEHIKKNISHKERFFVEYDEYLPNIVENKIIKTTLKKLYKLSKNFKNQKRIREFLFLFDEVDESCNFKNLFSKITKNRNMKYYEKVLNLSKIFLLNQSLIPYKGKNEVFAILFDMNRLFEDYVGSWFKKRYKNVKLQDKQHKLFENKKRFSLIPDIVIDNKVILDTKWKIINNENDISQSDLYQMFAYASKYQEVKRIYLIYPLIEDNPKFNYKMKICDKKKTIRVVYFDLKRT